MAALLVRMNTGDRGDGWVHMRVERLSLLDVTTVRRNTQLDFTYPKALPPVAQMLALDADALLPLTLFTKGARLAGFHVQDEEGQQLPVLTRRESGERAATCLVGLAETVARRADVTVAVAVADALQALARFPRSDAQDLFARMRDRAERAAPSRKQAEARLGPTWSGPQPGAQRSPSEAVEEADSALESYDALLWTMLSDPTLNTLARGLAEQFMLLTPLARARLHERRLFTYGYADTYRTPAGTSASRRFAGAVRESLGWKASQYDLEVPGIARAQSYQAEIVAPPTLEIIYAELRATRPRLAASDSAIEPAWPRAPFPRALAAAWKALRERGDRRATGYQAPATRAALAGMRAVRVRKPVTGPLMRIRARAPDSMVALQFESGDHSNGEWGDGVPAGSQGLAVVGFQASRIGLVRSAPLLGSLIVGLLFIGKARLSSIHDDGAAAALLLAVPTLFAAAIARPGEHALATRLLLGTRALVMVTGLASFVAAAALTAGWSIHDQHTMWEWAVWSAAAAEALLLMGLLISLHRSWRERRAWLVSLTP